MLYARLTLEYKRADRMGNQVKRIDCTDEASTTLLV